MATTYEAENATKRKPSVTDDSPAEVVVKGSVSIGAALAAGDLIKLCKLPANRIPTVRTKFSATDMDTDATPALALDFGFLNAAGTDIGSELIAGSTIGQDGSEQAPTAAKVNAISSTNADRIVGAKAATGAATGASGTLTFELAYINT